MLSESFNDELRDLVYETHERIRDRAKFYTRAWNQDFRHLSQKGEQLLMRWIVEQIKEVEDRAERILWTMSCPLSILKHWVDRAETITQTELHIAQEDKKYEELELCRFDDEGGPVGACG